MFIDLRLYPASTSVADILRAGCLISKESSTSVKRSRCDLGVEILLGKGLGGQLLLFTWRGDAVNQALTAILAHLGYSANNYGVAVAVSGNLPSVTEALRELTATTLSRIEFLYGADLPPVEKWDWCVAKEVRKEALLTGALDIGGALEWINTALAV